MIGLGLILLGIITGNSTLILLGFLDLLWWLRR